MRAMLSQTDLDDALEGFRKKDVKTWTDEEKCRDRKAPSHIHLYLSNNILQEVLAEKTTAALWLAGVRGFSLHIGGFSTLNHGVSVFGFDILRFCFLVDL
jgi:hypothetical protein